jgi:ferredoxin-NADP reductase
MERAALPGRLALPERLNDARATVAWRLARVTGLTNETARARTISLDVPGWAGQHLDVRLTAEDAYQTERSYSSASAPENPTVALTVERIDDGEVSPYLTQELRVGDDLELRGPFGGYFNWRRQDGGPVLLIAGGSELAPLMAILRHRTARASTVEARLLLSARSYKDVLYREELRKLAAARVAVHHTFTRQPPPGWRGFTRRIDAEMLAVVGPAPRRMARIYVCGPTAFVEQAADLLVRRGHAATAIRTKRFGRNRLSRD